MVRPNSTLFTLSLALGSSLLTESSAHATHVGRGCSGDHLAKRNPFLFPAEGDSHLLTKRQDGQGYDPNTLDPVAQCTGYSYQPVLDNKSKFPTIWDTASLVPGDQAAADLFAKAQAQVAQLAPDCKVKGTLNGDFCESTTPFEDDLYWITDSDDPCTVP